MFTCTTRTVLMCVSVTLAALAGARAAAELPLHPSVETFHPIEADFDIPGPSEPPRTFDLHFGDTVAIRNGIAFASIPLSHGGRIAVFNQTASGWQRVQTLNAPIPGQRFGRPMTFRDGLLIVGDRDQAAAYVYKRSNGVWTLRQTLRPPTTDSVTLFPVALKYEAGTLLATGERVEAHNLVYVFELDTNGRFSRRTKLRALDARPFDGFGISLSMTNTTLVMGSFGAAYVFKRNSLGNWTQTQKLVPVGTAKGFGSSVAIDQGMIIVGAPNEDVETEFDTPDGHWAGGAAYVFLPVAGRYLESLRLRPRIDEKFRYVGFGSRISVFGRHIAIDAVGPPTFVSIMSHGIVFTYTRDGSSVLARGTAQGHLAGTSMALANNWLLVGDLGDERCPFGCPGSATLYDINRLSQ